MPDSLPKHVAIIMDGNGRWAKAKNLPRTSGHEAGMKTAKNAAVFCTEKGIDTLTLFAFGHENWKRPEVEVHFLMDLFVKGLRQEINELVSNNICLRIVGDHQGLSEKLRSEIKEAEVATQNNTGLRLIIALNYSGRWDILAAAKKIVEQVNSGKIKLDQIDEQLFSSSLVTENFPEPDLLIRTSGEQRMSNFMLWQSAYTELYFTEIFWPDFNNAEFQRALDFFASRERRFGKTTEQLGQNNVEI